MINILIVRNVTDGDSIFANGNIEDIFSLPVDYIKHDKELFMLRVSDESMINLRIRKNDLVIIERSEIAEDGQMIVVQVDGYITIKRFFKEKNYVRLEPENDTMDSIIVNECKILGKL